jgi:hypothetical protein
MVNVDAAPCLVELPETHNAGLQLWNVVHSSECVVSTGLAGEDDGASSLDLGDGAVTELDGAADLGVKLDRNVSRPSNVVGGASVEDPVAVVVLLYRTKISKNMLLLDVDDASRCCRWGRGYGSGVDDDNCQLVEDDVMGQ